MRFLDLGALAVDLDGSPRPLGGRRVEAVAAALLVHAGAPLPASALVDAVWGAHAPAGAAGALDSLVWRLRRVLEPDRAPRGGTVLRRDEHGYRLAVPPAAIDSHVATAAMAAAETSTAPADVLRITDDALGRWRGTPYAGVPDTGWLEPVRARLAEVRVALQQHRLDALLATGRPDRVVADLAALLAEHPYRESLWERRMLALYRCGRQEAALAAFHELRGVLAAELGVEPGPGPRRLLDRILAHDPALSAPGTATAGSRGVEVHLPRYAGRLVGRDAGLRALASSLVPGRVVTVTGPGGCGKTRLAVEVAADVSGRYPDGVWFVGLSSVSDADPAPGDRVADAVAATVGLDPGRRTPLDALRAFLADRTALLVLDNCEQVVEGAADAVEAVLDAAPAVAVLATSRQPLGVDGERVQALAPLALPVADDPDALAASPAVTLFRERVAARGEPTALDGADGGAIARICAAVDGLPLGLELAAARVGTFSVLEIADGLGRDPGTLSRLGRGPARQRTLRDEVDWSYRLAPPEERIAHRRLAVLPRPFTLDAAEAVCGTDPLRPAQVLDLVGGLVHRSLLASTAAPHPGGPTWFGQLDTIRAHAAGVLREAGEEESVIAARTRWVVDRVAAAPRYGRPGQPEWYTWLDANRAAVEASIEAALRPGAPPPDAMIFVVARLMRYWLDRMHVVTARRLVELAARADGAAPLATAVATATHGALFAVDQDMAAARPRLLATLPELLAAPPERWGDVGELLTGVTAAVWVGDDFTLAAEFAATTAAFGERTGDLDVVLTARAIGSACELLTGSAPAAVAQARAVQAENAGVDNGFVALFAGATLGIAAGLTGDAPGALWWSEENLRQAAALGNHDVADMLERQARHLDELDRPDDAVRVLAAAAVRQRRVGRSWPRIPDTVGRLDRLRSALGEDRFALAWRAGSGLDLADLVPAPAVDRTAG